MHFSETVPWTHMDSDGTCENVQVSASKKWLTLAELMILKYEGALYRVPSVSMGVHMIELKL